MNRAEKLRALRADVDALAQAEEATVLASLPHWDSLAVLLVIVHFEEKHRAAVSGAQVRGCRTVADLLALVP